MIDRYKLYLWMLLGVFWIQTCYGFIGEELIPPIMKARNMVFLLCDFVFLILGFLTVRKRGDLVVIGSFLAIAVLSTIILNGESWITLFNGCRDFFGVLMAIPVIRWFYTHDRAPEFRRTLEKMLRFWLWLQAFCITWQFLRYGANDHGGGSMGEGASGMVSMLIYLISFFLITRRWDYAHYLRSLRENWVYIFLLYPTFLNETKVSFLMFAGYFLLLLRYDRQLVVKLFYIIPLTVVAFIGIGSLYFSATQQDQDKVLSEEFFEEYLYGLDLDFLVDVAQKVQDGVIEVDPRDWWVVDIPRFAKFILVEPVLEETEGGLALGAGVGQFKGSSIIEATGFYNENQWLLQGSRPWLFFLFVQIGIVGILWWFCTAFYQYIVRGSRRPFSRQFQLFLWASISIILFYNDSFRELYFSLMIAFLIQSYRYVPADTPAGETLPGNPESEEGGREPDGGDKPHQSILKA